MSKIKKSHGGQAKPEPQSYFLINNQFIDSKCTEGEITKLQASAKMICQLLEQIRESDEIDYSILEDIKFIISDYLQEIDHIYNY